jgi:hypothetical protein
MGRFHRLAMSQSAFIGLAILTARSILAQAPGYATIYSFKGGADGLSPHAGVTLGPNGTLFGTTYEGGSGSLGTVFELLPSSSGWRKVVLHSFSGSDGSLPATNWPLVRLALYTEQLWREGPVITVA